MQVVAGSEHNIETTCPRDLAVAEALAAGMTACPGRDRVPAHRRSC